MRLAPITLPYRAAASLFPAVVPKPSATYGVLEPLPAAPGVEAPMRAAPVLRMRARLEVGTTPMVRPPAAMGMPPIDAPYSGGAELGGAPKAAGSVPAATTAPGTGDDAGAASGSLVAPGTPAAAAAAVGVDSGVVSREPVRDAAKGCGPAMVPAATGGDDEPPAKAAGAGPADGHTGGGTPGGSGDMAGRRGVPLPPNVAGPML